MSTAGKPTFTSRGRENMKKTYVAFIILLVGALPAMAGGPGFTGDVTITNTSPDIVLTNTLANKADWELCTDDNGCNTIGTNTGRPAESFNIGWKDATPFGVPFTIENGTASNLLYLDSAERIGVNTNVPGFTVDAVGDRIRLRNSTYSIQMRVDGAATDIQAIGADLFLRSSTAGENIVMNPFSGDDNVGIGLTAPTAKLHVSGDVIVTGDVALGSSRTIKHELAPVPQQEILDELLGLAVYRWKYKEDTLQASHVGPMAEDMYERFGLGRDNQHLSPADSAGLALAAIQGLHQRFGKEIVELRGVNAELEAENRELAQRLEALEQVVLEMQ